jgi:hypothetical protein
MQSAKLIIFVFFLSPYNLRAGLSEQPDVASHKVLSEKSEKTSLGFLWIANWLLGCHQHKSYIM